MLDMKLFARHLIEAACSHFVQLQGCRQEVWRSMYAWGS